VVIDVLEESVASIFKVDVIGSSKMLVNFTRRCHDPEDHNINYQLILNAVQIISNY
jgi:hypothetical protein